MNRVVAGMAVLSVGLLAGCASITKGTSQTLIFNLEPSTARCVLTRDGDGEIGSITVKNNTVTVGKDKDDIVVKCNALGYLQKTTRLTSSAETAGVVGGFFIDLGITDMPVAFRNLYAVEEDSQPLAEKIEAMQHFAETVIAKS